MAIQRLHDEIIIKAIEPLFTDNSEDVANAFSFADRYVIAEDREDVFFNRHSEFEERTEPFFAFLFSRLLVHFSTQAKDELPKEFQLVKGNLNIRENRDSDVSSISPYQVVQKSFIYSLSSRSLIKVYEPTILTAIISDKTIYHAIAHFMLILLHYYKHSKHTSYLWTKLNVAMNFT